VRRGLERREEIFFSAGTHEDAIQMSFRDFAEIVQPMTCAFASPARSMPSESLITCGHANRRGLVEMEHEFCSKACAAAGNDPAVRVLAGMRNAPRTVGRKNAVSGLYPKKETVSSGSAVRDRFRMPFAMAARLRGVLEILALMSAQATPVRPVFVPGGPHFLSRGAMFLAFDLGLRLTPIVLGAGAGWGATAKDFISSELNRPESVFCVHD
jgi:hypothetical protein